MPVVGAAASFLAPAIVRADSIGLAQLRTMDPTLNGSGVRVAQIEAGTTNGASAFKVNPSNFYVQQTAPNFFTYYSSNGATATFNDGVVGVESGHANQVAAYFYGMYEGVSTNVSHVDNYDADYFINTLIPNSGTTSAQVFNQSFIEGDASGNGIQDNTLDQQYDNYVASLTTRIFVSGAGNSGKPASPSTMYNGISVGAYGGSTATGPTTDGRSKPDIVETSGETSDATAVVSGVATILVQAGARGDGGVGTGANAQDFRVIKALLLNGAVKPAGWSHTATAPLDPLYGAGLVNVYNSYMQLAGGQHSFIATQTVPTNSAHLPVSATGVEPSNLGWDYQTLTSSPTLDAVNHYFFNVTSTSTLTATLDWERQSGQSGINNLELFLYDPSGNLIDSSVSMLDNVQELYDVNLPTGVYDLEVLKVGRSGEISPSETYGLAYNFAATPEPGVGLTLITGSLLMLRRRRVRKPVGPAETSQTADN